MGDREIETATVVFTDLVGSTAIRTALGDDDADALREEHDRCVKRATRTHGGTVVKSTGDGFLLRFDSANNALEAASSIQRDLQVFNAGDSQTELHVRIGVSAGDVAVEPGDIHGTPVVEAARLEATAEGDEVLCSPIVRQLAGSRGDFAFHSRGSVRLKGLTEPMEVFIVDWRAACAAADEAPSAPSPAIGIDRPQVVIERDDVLRALVSSLDSDSIQVVAGEAGIGKSTVLAELAHRVDSDREVLFGSADDLGAAPYQAFRDALQAAEPRLFGDYLGSSGESPTARVRLFEQIRSVLQARAENRSLSLIIDDVHWLDDGSALLLRYLAGHRIEGLDLVLGLRTGALQPGQLMSDVLVDLRRGPRFTQHDLRPFSLVACLQLAAAVGAEIHDAAELLARTTGNPLFVREVLRAGDPTGVDDALAEIVMRRLRQIPGPAVDLLEAGSIIGAIFDLATAATVAEIDRGDALDVLDHAEAAGLVTPVDSAQYRFRHALVRDAIVSGLPRNRRAQLHHRTAESLRQSGGDTGLVAFHYVEAVPAAPRSLASKWSRQAGRQALRELGFEQAVVHLANSLEFLPTATAQSEIFELKMDLGRALTGAGRWQEAKRVYSDAAHLAEELGDPIGRADAVIGMFGQPEDTGLEERPPAIVERALNGTDDPARSAMLAAWHLIAARDRGDDAAVDAMIDEAIGNARRAGSAQVQAFVRRAQLRSWWDPFRLDDRTAIADELLNLGRDDAPDISAWGHRWHVICDVEGGRLSEALDHARSLETIARQTREPFHLWFALTRQAVVLDACGEFDEASSARATGLKIGQVFKTQYVTLIQAVIGVGAALTRGEEPSPDDLQVACRDHGSAHWSLLAAVLLDEDIDATAAEIKHHLRGSQHQHHPANVALWAPEIAWRLRDQEMADLALTALSSRPNGFGGISAGAFFAGSIDHKIGICQHVLGRYADAVDSLARGAAREREIGAKPAMVRSMWACGNAMHALGRHHQADELISEASELATALGISRLSLLRLNPA